MIELLVDSWLVSQSAESCCGFGMGTVQEPRGRGMSTVGSHYQKMGEDQDCEY
jgi:hypothetical protein